MNINYIFYRNFFYTSSLHINLYHILIFDLPLPLFPLINIRLTNFTASFLLKTCMSYLHLFSHFISYRSHSYVLYLIYTLIYTFILSPQVILTLVFSVYLIFPIHFMFLLPKIIIYIFCLTFTNP